MNNNSSFSELKDKLKDFNKRGIQINCYIIDNLGKIETYGAFYKILSTDAYELYSSQEEITAAGSVMLVFKSNAYNKFIRELLANRDDISSYGISSASSLPLELQKKNFVDNKSLVDSDVLVNTIGEFGQKGVQVDCYVTDELSYVDTDKFDSVIMANDAYVLGTSKGKSEKAKASLILDLNSYGKFMCDVYISNDFDFNSVRICGQLPDDFRFSENMSLQKDVNNKTKVRNN